jgi:hypothetical protein
MDVTLCSNFQQCHGIRKINNKVHPRGKVLCSKMEPKVLSLPVRENSKILLCNLVLHHLNETHIKHEWEYKMS